MNQNDILLYRPAAQSQTAAARAYLATNASVLVIEGPSSGKSFTQVACPLSTGVDFVFAGAGKTK